MALEKSWLPEVDRNDLYMCSGYIDIDKINPDAWPALVADLSAGEQDITGYTRLFQPNKPVTKSQAAIALATGDAAEARNFHILKQSLAESAVNAHTALVAQVEKDLNASFEKELATERLKIDAVVKLAEEARLELERLRAEREEENNALIMGRAAVESEMEVLSRLRREVEEQLQKLMSNKVEISFEKDRINKLQRKQKVRTKSLFNYNMSWKLRGRLYPWPGITLKLNVVHHPTAIIFNTPEACFFFTDDLVLIDHNNGDVYVLSL